MNTADSPPALDFEIRWPNGMLFKQEEKAYFTELLVASGLPYDDLRGGDIQDIVAKVEERYPRARR